MLLLQNNGRVSCPERGISSRQYAAVQAQPRQYYSKDKQTFSFWPTPLGLSRMKEAGFELPADIDWIAQRWNRFVSSQADETRNFSSVLKTTPWKHQPGAIDFGIRCPSPYFNMGMGTGKSLVTIGTIGANRHQKTLILCPNAVVGVWPREFRRHAHEGQYEVLALNDDYSSVAKKVEAAKRHMQRGGQRVITVNYESARKDPFAKWAEDQKWDCVVCDEIHRIKAHSGPTVSFARNLECGQPIGLSGTMLPHSPLDAWGQFSFLEPALLGSNYMEFKKRYAVEGKYGEVLRFVNLDELHERLKPLLFKVSSDVLDLPPATHQQFRFRLSSKVMKIYEKVKKELFARIGDGVVTADNVLVRGLRLQQLTSGFYADDVTKQNVPLDEQPKLDAMLDWLDAIPSEEKFVIFTRFKWDVETVVAAILKARPRLKVGRLTGDRNDLTRDATFDTSFDCYVVNIASGGVGVDLTAANHALYYSVSWNGGDYEQSLRRLLRPGQPLNCHFSHLIAEGTVDEDVYDGFLEKKELASIVIDGIRKGGAR